MDDKKFPDAHQEKSDVGDYASSVTFYNGVVVGLPLFNCCTLLPSSSRVAESTFPRLDLQPQPPPHPRLHILLPKLLPRSQT
jgi:hypothetical protein